MKPILLILLLLAPVCSAEPDIEINDDLALALGRIQHYQDMVTRYEAGNKGLGHYYLGQFVKEEYDARIAQLPVKNRIEYFWGVIALAKFGVDGTEQMTELIAACCANAFITSAHEYLKNAEIAGKESPNYVDERMVKKAKFFMAAVSQHKSVNKQQSKMPGLNKPDLGAKFIP